MSCDSLCIVSTSQAERKLRNRSPTFHPLNSKGAALNRAHFEIRVKKQRAVLSTYCRHVVQSSYKVLSDAYNKKVLFHCWVRLK